MTRLTRAKGLFVTRQKGGYFMGLDIQKESDGSQWNVLFFPFKSIKEVLYKTASHHEIYKLVKIRDTLRSRRKKGGKRK